MFSKIVPLIALFFISACSSQDEYKNEFPPRWQGGRGGNFRAVFVSRIQENCEKAMKEDGEFKENFVKCNMEELEKRVENMKQRKEERLQSNMETMKTPEDGNCQAWTQDYMNVMRKTREQRMRERFPTRGQPEDYAVLN